jgi:hypothetical protein
MQERISTKNWEFDFDVSFTHTTSKDRAKRVLRKYLGINLGYRNYKMI